MFWNYVHLVAVWCNLDDIYMYHVMHVMCMYMLCKYLEYHVYTMQWMYINICIYIYNLYLNLKKWRLIYIYIHIYILQLYISIYVSCMCKHILISNLYTILYVSENIVYTCIMCMICIYGDTAGRVQYLSCCKCEQSYSPVVLKVEGVSSISAYFPCLSLRCNWSAAAE